MKKTDLRVAKTKRAIRSTFINLLEKKEFSNITVAEIARESSINRKTFYLHYSCVEDLIKEFEDDQLKQVMNMLNQNATLDVGMFIDAMNEVLSDNRTFYRLISMTGRNSFFLPSCENMVYTLLKSSFCHPLSHQDDYRLRFLSIGIVGVYMDWLSKNSQSDLNEIKTILSDIIEVHLNDLIK